MPPQTRSNLGARVLATSEMVDAAAEEVDTEVTTPPPPPTCPVCMEPWTCNDNHRICCIPCGHVYGRSCLERWLDRSAHDTAKCPQCGKQFGDEHITNLYAPGNLWDGCCRIQEFKVKYKSIHESAIDTVRAEMEEKIEYCRATTEQAIHETSRLWNENMATMKDQMKKMAVEENATATDLIEFMERSFPQLPHL